MKTVNSEEPVTLQAAVDIPGLPVPQTRPVMGIPLPKAAESSTAIVEVEDDEFDYESLGDDVATSTHLLAGSIAGIVEHTVMYPFDSIKTRFQQVAPNPKAVYSGITQAFTRISATEGTRALWRGVTSVVIGAGPAHAAHFAVYEKCKKALISRQRNANPGNHQSSYHMSHAIAGACATITNDALMNPFDVVKQRMQSYGTQYRNVFDCGMAVLRKEGLAAFYISYLTTISMTIPFQSIHFVTYEYFRKRTNPKGYYNPKAHIISGALAGAVAAAATTPLDVVKTLLQTKGESKDLAVKHARGFWDGCKIISKRHGVTGFFRGMTPRIMSHMPATAVCWLSYEHFKWIIHMADKR